MTHPISSKRFFTNYLSWMKWNIIVIASIIEINNQKSFDQKKNKTKYKWNHSITNLIMDEWNKFIYFLIYSIHAIPYVFILSIPKHITKFQTCKLFFCMELMGLSFCSTSFYFKNEWPSYIVFNLLIVTFLSYRITLELIIMIIYYNETEPYLRAFPMRF